MSFREEEEKELTFQPKKISKNSSRNHIGLKKSSVSTYREYSKTTNLHERLAQEKLKQKDEEIERLRKELQNYKNKPKPKKRKSVDPCSKFKRPRHPLHVQRSSKSPSCRKTEDPNQANLSFQPKINSKSKKLLRGPDV